MERKPKRRPKKEKTLASKGWHVPNDTSAHYEEVKKPFKIKIPLSVIFVGFLIIFWVFFLFSQGTNNDLPDYMTSQHKAKQLDIPQEPQQTEPFPQPTTMADAIDYMFENGGWFKFIIFIPLIVITWQILNSFMRAMR